VVDVYPSPIKPSPIRLANKKIHQVLGIQIPSEQVKDYLEDLELKARRENQDVFMVTPPSFRGDLEREIDLIEEIARLNGYDRIPMTLPKSPPSGERTNKEFLFQNKALEIMTLHGYHEIITYSFTSASSSDLIQLGPDDPRRRQLRILNPLTEDFSAMRTTLVPGLMETARYNLSRKNTNLKLFELRRVFLQQEGERLPKEMKFLAGLAMGFDRDPHWSISPRSVDFYDIKGCVEDLLDSLQIKEAKFIKKVDDIPYLHPGKGSKLVLGDEVLGVLGEVHPQVVGHYEVHGEVYLFELDFSRMVKWAEGKKRFQPLPKFPAVYRDLSIVVDGALEGEGVTETIRTFHHPFVEEVTLFDIYQGVPIPEGKKGISYRIRYQANDRTLTDEEVNRYHEEILSRLKEVFQLDLRQ
jgi:phenylalanyl-tRNA synthetase beta chain